MPELPEVEVVRRGLAPYVTGRRIDGVDVLHDRAVRRHPGGAQGLADALVGRRIECVSRRGKYLWFRLDDDQALVAHLGMSGQLLLPPRSELSGPHVRVEIRFDQADRDLRFVDQRTFGGMHIHHLVADDASGRVPVSVSHIARDPLDPLFNDQSFISGVRRSHAGIKRCLLDQRLVSGIGNIYADEALWRTRLHYDRPGSQLTRREALDVLGAARAVMEEALAQGGTSFDSLYVNVNGESGWFARSLDAYGREGEPCHRCGRPLVREPWMNRSSFRCPRCQPRPRTRSSPS